ncbi:MAG TPA: tetratricopeptide repeat protein, partial [Desulfuromonadaceae bacterium]
MPTIRPYIALLCVLPLLTGFTWGFGSDSCKDALDLVKTLDTLHDEAQVRQTEAKILSRCPDGAAAHYVTAQQYERVGNVDAAIGEYRTALRQEPGFSQASGNLGLLYARKGMEDDASVELARGLASAPKPAYHRAMGRILTVHKVFPLAIYHYNEAARGLATDASLFSELAETYVAAGQPDKALDEYRRALAVDPRHVKAHLGIATIFLGRNQPDKALEELKQAAATEPENRQVHLMLAGIYEKKGDAKQAEYENLLGGKGKGKAAAAQPIPPTPAAAQPR